MYRGCAACRRQVRVLRRRLGNLVGAANIELHTGVGIGADLVQGPGNCFEVMFAYPVENKLVGGQQVQVFAGLYGM